MMATPPLYRPALLTALRGGYSRTDLLADLGAGALVGVVALPLSIALAIASGVRPEQGLWTAVIGGLLISLLGGSRVQIGGPAGAFVGLCAAAINQFGFPGLALATLMAGLMTVFLGLARLGTVISFIPVPVVIGFTSGIALILASTQLGPALGIPDPEVPIEHLHERLTWIGTHFSAVHVQPVLLCVGAIAIILGLRRLGPRIPGGLIAVAVAAVVVHLLGIEGSGPDQVATIATRFPQLADGLPAFSWPTLAWFAPDPQYLERLAAHGKTFSWLTYLTSLSEVALAFALLGAIESLLSAVVADGMTGHRHDSNSELIGQGVANLIGPFFGCLPATGVIARTATNVRAGARTPVAGIVHALIVLTMLLVLAPLVVHIPLAALAGVLLVVCWSMAEIRHWPHILRASRGDAFLLPLAFGLTAFIGLAQAILIGTVLAMFVFVRRMAEATHIERHSSETSSTMLAMTLPAGVVVYDIRGPFFFGAATLLRDLDGESGPRAQAMILRLGNVPFIDATAGFALRELVATLRKHGGHLLLSDIHTRPVMDLERLGMTEVIGAEQIHGTLESAVRRAGELVGKA